jgi:hypothetical protein
MATYTALAAVGQFALTWFLLLEGVNITRHIARSVYFLYKKSNLKEKSMKYLVLLSLMSSFAFAQQVDTSNNHEYTCSVHDDSFVTPQIYAKNGVREDRKLTEDFTLTKDLARAGVIINEKDLGNEKSVRLVVQLYRDNYDYNEILLLVSVQTIGPGMYSSKPIASTEFENAQTPAMLNINARAIEVENNFSASHSYTNFKFTKKNLPKNRLLKSKKKIAKELNVTLDKMIEENRRPENIFADDINSIISISCKKI